MPESRSGTPADASAPLPTARPTPDAVRAAAQAVKDAIDAHLSAVEARTGESDPAVQRAFDALQTAAESYDDLLFEAYDEVTPFEFGGAGESAPEGVADLDEAPAVINVFVRRDYAVAEPETLLQAGRAAAREVAAAEDGAQDGAEGPLEEEPESLGAALYELLHLAGVDGLDDAAEDVGLEPLGGTVWCLVGDEGGRPDDNPFDSVDPERLVFRVNELVGD